MTANSIENRKAIELGHIKLSQEITGPEPVA
jgi:hypothetical protein